MGEFFWKTTLDNLSNAAQSLKYDRDFLGLDSYSAAAPRKI
jgi:hypothetical protein